MCRGTNSLFRALLFQRKGLFRLIWPLLYLKPPRLKKIRTEMMPKNQKKTLVHRHPVLTEDTGVNKKRKRVDKFASLSSAAADKASVLAGDMEYFDLLAS
jgi:hypothetical protein